MTTEAMLAAVARTEAAIIALRDRLRPIPRSRLDQRLLPGEWSPMENVRHLIFAEQHHFSSLLKGLLWKSAGVPPPSRTAGETRLNPAGKDPATTVDEVFDVWLKVHAVVAARCLEQPSASVREQVVRDLHHLKLHARRIEQQLGLAPAAEFSLTAEELRAQGRRRRRR